MRYGSEAFYAGRLGDSRQKYYHLTKGQKHHKNVMQRRDEFAIWIDTQFKTDDLKLLTFTVADRTGFDGEQYTPSQENTVQVFTDLLTKYRNNPNDYASEYVFFVEGTRDKRTHIHGISDNKTAEILKTVWEQQLMRGFVQVKPVHSLLMSARYVAKHGQLIDGKFL